MTIRNIFIYPIEALNDIRTNVWAVALVGIGALLILHGHSDVGGNLITGGFALLRHDTANPTPPPPPTPNVVADPNAPKG